ncbi:metallophosphoesterase [Pelagibacterium lentulum]|uniref:Serine/threonine protein phosphatase n=1 Tax=Pelagibacterium lentulum TaxID=2029865 RepID=A0A916R5Z9_9HYPH|nr:metallophosphoesterase [Pelagibacterium lentulum]GGA36297.1 serine/threonine protein phosphatase [Pelagibacterium lentulum]
MGLLKTLFGRAHLPTESFRQRLIADWPKAIYAIGDVHGRLDLLCQLEQSIIEDSQSISGEKWIVMLGDYVDRGFDSAGVISHLLASAPHGFRRICLCGNHEAMMLDGLLDQRSFDHWLAFGGVDTLQSYGLSHHTMIKGRAPWHKLAGSLQAYIPADHIAFLRGLPVSLTVDDHIFVHAGLQPGRTLSDHSDTDLLWTRAQPDPESDILVVHGHTIVDAPTVQPGAINIDTGAFYRGILTCVRLMERAEPFFIQAAVNTTDLLHVPRSSDHHE